jgi:hypothetical protein
MRKDAQTYMVCMGGKCVDIRIKECDDLFDELGHQIECEELKKGL